DQAPPNAKGKTQIKARRKPDADAPSADSEPAPSGEPPRADRVQRVVRPTLPVPKHDDRRLAELGIRRYESKHLVLYTDIDPDAARPLPDLMDQAFAAWEAYFGPLPPDREGNVYHMIGYIMAD